MKVIHLINLDKMGGAEKIFLQFLSESKSENIIFCISNLINEDILKSLQDHEIHYVNRIFSPLKIKYPSFMRRYILQHKIEKQSADVIMVWDIVPGLNRKLRAIKMVYYDHGSSWRFQDNEKTRNFFSYIDGAIAASNASREVMQKRFSINVETVVINNVLPKVEYTAEGKSLPARESLILGTASRLVAIKGIGVSILTIAELLRRGVNAKLLIAGKGPNEHALKKLVKDNKLENNVFFLGHQNDLSSFYNEIHIYMSTSLTENYSLSCIDAILHNVPCLFSMVDGQPEVNVDGVTGVGIIPTLTMQSYEKQSGYSVNVARETPFCVYDPVNKKLTEPLMLSYMDCAEKIINILDGNKYAELLDGVARYQEMTKSQTEMSEAIDNFITRMSL